MSTYEEMQKELDSIRSNFIDNLDGLENINNEEFELLEPSSSKNIGPISNAGVVYKYDRGVIGIDEFGKKEEINIDEFDGNGGHSLAALFIGCLLNEECKEKYNTLPIMTPYESGKIVSDYGIYVILLEGDSMYVFIPANPTDIQKKALQEEIDLRGNFKIEYIENTKKVTNLK